MSKPGKAGTLLLAITLAGCANVPTERAPDWSIDQDEGPDGESAEVMEVGGVHRFALPAPPLSTEWLPQPWLGVDAWCSANKVAPARRLGNDAFAPAVLTLPHGTLLLTPGARAARWRGMELHLGYSPQVVGSTVMVHSLDWRKTLEPLVFEDALVLDRTRPLVIDPGHGGADPGALSSHTGLLEKELALDWARRVASILAASGWPVLLTRTNDIDLSLSERIAFADRVDASAFISLHFNSSQSDPSSGGVETYCLTPGGLPSTITRGYADDATAAWVNNEYDTQNLLLACAVQREMLAIKGVRDRGVRRARFMGVLRHQQRPAILVEGGYLSDPVEARLIGNPAYRQELAQAVARTVLRSDPFDNLAAARSSARKPVVKVAGD
jgi:N-acetylmuramoyl-L-alanine amidase